MSLPLKSVHVSLSPEAHEALRAIAQVKGQDIGQCARLILTEALLGKVHAIHKALEGLKRK